MGDTNFQQFTVGKGFEDPKRDILNCWTPAGIGGAGSRSWKSWDILIQQRGLGHEEKSLTWTGGGTARGKGIVMSDWDFGLRRQ